MKLERKYADGDYLGCILEIEAIEAKDRSGSEKTFSELSLLIEI